MKRLVECLGVDVLSDEIFGKKRVGEDEPDHIRLEIAFGYLLTYGLIRDCF